MFADELLTHPLKDTFRDGEFVSFGPHLCRLLVQLYFEFVQFPTACGDPFQQFGIQHAQNRRSAKRIVGCMDTIHDLAADDQVAARVATDFLRRPAVASETMADDCPDYRLMA